jgi:hypothetical protein
MKCGKKVRRTSRIGKGNWLCFTNRTMKLKWSSQQRRKVTFGPLLHPINYICAITTYSLNVLSVSAYAHRDGFEFTILSLCWTLL